MFLRLLTPLLLLTGCCCQLIPKAVYSNASKSDASSSSSSQRTRILSCHPPTAVLLIRTARYLQGTPSSSSSSSSSLANNSAGCRVGGKCRPPGDLKGKPGEPMTSSDITKVYRHCQGRLAWCDVTGAEVGQEFEMTYYCLKGPFIDPCSNITSEQSLNDTSILFNYSRHTTDCDVTCQCNITSLTSPDKTLYIRELNFFEEVHVGSQSPVRKLSSMEGCNHSTEQPGPRVMMASSKREWEVERRAAPGQWQLGKAESASLSLSLHGMQGVQFGHLWVDMKGEEMVISCVATIVPGPVTPVTFSPEVTSPEMTYPAVTSPLDDSYDSGYLIYVAVAAACVTAVILVFAVIVSVAKCKRRRPYSPHASTKDHTSPLPEASKQAYHSDIGSNCHIALEGEYCTIQPRDENEPISEETTFSHSPAKSTGGTTGPNGVTVTQAEERAVGGGGEYGTLHHGPAAQGPIRPRADAVIYDHMGAFRPSGDAEYHCLRHGPDNQPRIIDNIYDRMTDVKPS